MVWTNEERPVVLLERLGLQILGLGPHRNGQTAAVVTTDSHWISPHEVVNVPVQGLDPFPRDQWIHDVGFDGMRVVESSVGDALALNCSRIAIVGEEPDGRCIQGGESLWGNSPSNSWPS